ncbi:MAG TPA: hypothetical protein DCZ63_12975 [Geobacter sp.]|nr:hypothetical protein [Geobacter sp.]
MSVSSQLSKELRRTFPGLTCTRLETIWRWVVAMPEGRVMLPDADLVNPEEIIVALHLARHLAYRNTAELQKTIRGLSARRKRRLYTKSFGEITP